MHDFYNGAVAMMDSALFKVIVPVLLFWTGAYYISKGLRK